MEYLNSKEEISIDTWKKYYTNLYPNAIEDATEKIFNQLQNLKEAIMLTDRDMVTGWVEDLIIYKTYNGLYFQKAILTKLTKIKNKSYRPSTPEKGKPIEVEVEE